jgi:hypothetical protein
MEKHLLITFSIQEFKDLIHDAVSSEMKANKRITVLSEACKTEYLTRNQVSKMLGVCPKTLSTWITKGLIPASRLAGKIYIERKDVEESLVKIRTIKHARTTLEF